MKVFLLILALALTSITPIAQAINLPSAADMPDVAVSTPSTLAANVRSVISATGTYAAPAVGTLTNPPVRWALYNASGGTITITYPNPSGATISTTVLAGAVKTFRQYSSSGYANESGNDPLGQLDARYPQFTNQSTLPLYSSDGTFAQVGPSSTVKATMLPPALTGSSRVIKANTLKPGNSLFLSGSGQVSAPTVAAGNFTITPTLNSVDMTPTQISILLGASPANCVIWLELKQFTTGIMVKGYVIYGLQNSNTTYTFYLNPGGSIVASDYTVDRTFDVMAQWSVSNAQNYVISHAVSAWLFRPIQ